MQHGSQIGFDPCLCNEVKKLSRLLGRIYDAGLASTGVSITQLSVLRSIARHPGQPMSRVAEAMQMDRTTFYRAITPMLRDGWLKALDGADARSRSVAMTARGKRILAQANQRWQVVQQEVVEAYGKSASAMLLRDLEKLAAAAGGIGTHR